MSEETIVTDPTPGTPEYDTFMAQKADVGLGGEPAPELIAGKYKTSDDLNKGILELLKKTHGDDLSEFYKGLESGVGKAPETPPADPGNLQIPEVDTPNVDIAKYATEFTTKGTLSDESMEAMSKVMPKEMVPVFMEGLKAQATLVQNEIYKNVGGADKYQAMIGWAATNYTPDEIKSFNSMLANTDATMRNTAITALQSRYTAAVGNPPTTTVHGNSTGGVAADIYESTAQLKADMGNPLYTKDPAFRQKVMDKLGRSKIM
jgi:hypothetical protein